MDNINMAQLNAIDEAFNNPEEVPKGTLILLKSIADLPQITA